MAATALNVAEKAARKLVKELGFEDAEDTSVKKLQSRIVKHIESMNGDAIEDMDLSSRSKSLLEEVAEALDDDRKVVVGAAEESDEDEPVTKTKTKVKTKSPKIKSEPEAKVKTKSPKTKEKTAKKKSGASSWNPEYGVKRKEEGDRIRKAIKKGPKTIAEIAKIAKASEKRVAGHINWNNKKKAPPYAISKKGVVSYTLED